MITAVRSGAELSAVARRASLELADATAEEILRFAADEFGGGVAGGAFGVYDDEVAGDACFDGVHGVRLLRGWAFEFPGTRSGITRRIPVMSPKFSMFEC